MALSAGCGGRRKRVDLTLSFVWFCLLLLLDRLMDTEHKIFRGCGIQGKALFSRPLRLGDSSLGGGASAGKGQEGGFRNCRKGVSVCKGIWLV